MSRNCPKPEPIPDGRELQVSRSIEATPAVVWKVMTEQLAEWWCPKPWQTEVTALEWRSGGRFETIMRGPDDQVLFNRGLFLEVTPESRLVFTDAFCADWVPQGPFMVGILEIKNEGQGRTRYVARARHWSDESLQQHQETGFEAGWGAVADQLAALCEGKAA